MGALRRLALLILLLSLCACSSIQSLRPGPDSAGGPGEIPAGGITMVYAQSPATVFDATLQSLAPTGLRLVEMNPSQLYILAERGVNAMSNGENVGIYIRPQGEGSQVTVVSRRKVATNVMAKDFAMPLHLQLGATLGRAGK